MSRVLYKYSFLPVTESNALKQPFILTRGVCAPGGLSQALMALGHRTRAELILLGSVSYAFSSVLLWSSHIFFQDRIFPFRFILFLL